MKYIRTKDGIIVDTTKYKNVVERTFNDKVVAIDLNHWGQDNDKYPTWIDVKDIIKQADTIEELCDEFYIDYGQERFPYSTYRQYERYAGWGDLIRYLREIHFTGYDGVYGYIWVILPNNAPILKPVAKMKGVLPDGKIDWEVL